MIVLYYFLLFSRVRAFNKSNKDKERMCARDGGKLAAAAANKLFNFRVRETKCEWLKVNQNYFFC